MVVILQTLPEATGRPRARRMVVADGRVIPCGLKRVFFPLNGKSKIRREDGDGCFKVFRPIAQTNRIRAA
jgi:hypothetical protein